MAERDTPHKHIKYMYIIELPLRLSANYTMATNHIVLGKGGGGERMAERDTPHKHIKYMYIIELPLRLSANYTMATNHIVLGNNINEEVHRVQLFLSTNLSKDNGKYLSL